MKFMCDEMIEGLRRGRAYERGERNKAGYVHIECRNTNGHNAVVVNHPYDRAPSDDLLFDNCQADDWRECVSYPLTFDQMIPYLLQGRTVEMCGLDGTPFCFRLRINSFNEAYQLLSLDNAPGNEYATLDGALVHFAIKPIELTFKCWRVVE